MASGETSGAAGVVVPGVPAGWELVRIGTPQFEDWYIDDVGHVVRNEMQDHAKVAWPIIRRVPPVCEWPLGVFADGWLAEDSNGEIVWYSERPDYSDHEEWMFRDKDDARRFVRIFDRRFFFSPPVFREDVPWTRRIQQVGPKYEAGLGLAGGGQ